jgi:hypothetical protein
MDASGSHKLAAVVRETLARERGAREASRSARSARRTAATSSSRP